MTGRRRAANARKLHLTDMLFFELCSVICGEEIFEDMGELRKAK
jgi:hypothetical protein